MSKFQLTYNNDAKFLRLINDGVVQVNSDGSVFIGDKQVNPIYHESGYVRIAINRKAYDTKIIKLHRLVWMAFNGMIPLGMFIDHIDEDKTNNRLDNLRLVTHAKNMLNRKSMAPRLTEDEAIAILLRRKAGETVKAIASDYPHHYNTISDLTRGRTYKHLDRYRNIVKI